MLECGLLAGSFIPPAEIKAARDVLRYRGKVAQQRVSEIARLGNVLQDALLTELREEVSQLSGRVLAGVCTFPAHDRNGRSSAGSGVAGGVAAGVA